MTMALLLHLQLPAGSPAWALAVSKPALVAHIGGGLVGILAGYAALIVRKGERLHRAFGTLFFASMLLMATMATFLAVIIHQKANITGGILAFYLTATAWATVKWKEGTTGPFEISAAAIAFGIAAVMANWGLEAMRRAHGVDGYASVFYFIFAGIAAFAASLDVKMILRGGISGAGRIARHLWRMCFALFFAAASFFLGQQKDMPAFMHGSPILTALGVAPLAFLAFWIIRVRLTRWHKPAPAAA